MVETREDLGGVGAQISGTEVNHHAVLAGVDKETGIRGGDLVGTQAVLAAGRASTSGSGALAKKLATG